MLKANGGVNSYSCSCPKAGSAEIHSPDCRCRCLTCDTARSCPCNPDEECECLLLCNCQCRNCHTAPSLSEPEDIVIGAYRTCISPSCNNLTPPVGSLRCGSCIRYRRAMRECMIGGCPNPAPEGGYGGHGIFCAQCSKKPGIFDRDEGCRRVCQENGCNSLAPFGCLSGTRCQKCKSKRWAIGQCAKKRKREVDDVSGREDDGDVQR